MSSTIDYYNRNAQAFIDSSIDADVRDLYDKFLPDIPAGGRILDAGCGAGRDTLAFRELGYLVDAFDASEEMVKYSRSLTGVDVKLDTFMSFDSEADYDGIWACASLLHVPRSELASTIKKLFTHLKDGGHFYFSMKLGDGERRVNGRTFTDFSIENIADLIEDIDKIILRGFWITNDVRPERSDQWINVILAKQLQPNG
jgi:2-polyprenyl-3-methyl-5-hydroxy-6-metoxy-1,4-benzoquinol methylase